MALSFVDGLIQLHHNFRVLHSDGQGRLSLDCGFRILALPDETLFDLAMTCLPLHHRPESLVQGLFSTFSSQLGKSFGVWRVHPFAFSPLAQLRYPDGPYDTGASSRYGMVWTVRYPGQGVIWRDGTHSSLAHFPLLFCPCSMLCALCWNLVRPRDKSPGPATPTEDGAFSLSLVMKTCFFPVHDRHSLPDCHCKTNSPRSPILV